MILFINNSQLSSFLLVILILVSTARRIFTAKTDNYMVCETEKCKEIAAYILDGLDPQRDPCDDFYEFTCGRWQDTNPLPEGENVWSRREVLNQQIKKRLIDLLEAEDDINATDPVKSMRKIYQDCMDEDAIDRIGIEPLDKILKKMDDWPLLTNDSGASVNWQELHRDYAELLGDYSLFHITTARMVDLSERPTYLMQIEGPRFPGSNYFPVNRRWGRFLMNGETFGLYRNFTLEVVKVFLQHRKIPYSEEKLRRDIDEMLSFEANLFIAQKDAEDPKNEMRTIRVLQYHYNMSIPSDHSGTTEINWLEVITNIFKFTNVSINKDEVISTPVRKYLIRLGMILYRASNHVVVNYLHWNFIATMIQYTDQNTRGLVNNFIKLTKLKSRRESCLDECKLLPVLYNEYVKKYYTPCAKENALQMAEELRKGVLYNLGESSWIDRSTKSRLFKKVKAIDMLIGYPNWYSDEKLVEGYKDLKPAATYVETMMNYIKFQNSIDLRKFQQPVSESGWPINELGPFASFRGETNKIIVTMALIHAHDSCDDRLPRAVPYGLDGVIVGHEIFHSLDSNCLINMDIIGVTLNIRITRDENDNFIEAPDKTRKIFWNKILCFIDEYGGIMFIDKDPRTGVPIFINSNQDALQRESIADTCSIHTTFQVFQEEETDKNDLRLPGLENYNSDQLFFISSASRMCITGTEDWWMDNFGIKDEANEHVPSRIRVNNQLKTFNEFSKAFNCSTAHRMNHKQKCTIFGS